MSRKLAPHRVRSSLRSAINRSALAILSTSALCSMASGSLTVVGAPGYNSTTGTGYKIDTIDLTFQPGTPLNSSGAAVGYSDRYTASADVGPRAMRWDGSGTGIELENLGVNGSGFTSMPIFSVNSSGVAVGGANEYSSGSQIGSPAVRWSSTGAATELDGLGLNTTGSTVSRAYSINAGGTSAGWSSKYESGVYKGTRAARWSSTGTAVTELGNLGLSASNTTNAEVNAVNTQSQAAGFSEKYVSGVFRGTRAVRWHANGTAAEASNLGLDANSSTDAVAYDIADTNDFLGAAVGQSEKYTSAVYKGTRAVHWLDSSSTVVELGNLGLDANGVTNAAAYKIRGNRIVGYSEKYVSNVLKGTRAVVWNATDGTATELETLLQDSSALTNARALAITSYGIAAGWAESNSQMFAVVWQPDGTIVPLGNLGLTDLAGEGTWALTSADSIAENGWVSGIGSFNPTGPAPAYTRRFVTQVGFGGEFQALFGFTQDWSSGGSWSTGTPAMEQGEAIFSANFAYDVAISRNESTRAITVSAGDIEFEFNDDCELSTDSLTIDNADITTVTFGTSNYSINTETLSIVDGTFFVAADASLSVGHLDSTSNGTLHIQMGTATISESITTVTSGLTFASNLGGTINARLRGLFNVHAIGEMTIGDATNIHGFRSDGVIEVDELGILEILDRDFAVLGTETIVDGGTILATNGLSLGSGRALLGHGTVAARFSAATGSFIEADGNLTIGADTPNGFTTFGELHVGAHTVTLVDSNQVVLGAGSWTTLDGGTLDAETSADGLLIDFGATITGSGTIMAPDDPFNPTMLNGEVIGESLANPIEIGGFVRGVGTVDNVTFTGTYSPGFSPAQVFVGNFGYSSSSTAIMEIGGETPGSEHDQIVSSGTIQLNGTLQLDVINNYDPDYYSAHEIFSAMQIVGIFSEVEGVEFATDKYLAVTYDSNSVFVTAALPGDANLDGEVGFADLLTVAQNYDLSGMSWVTGDFDGTGIIGFSDLLLAAQNYGMTMIEGELSLDVAMHARFGADWQIALSSVPEPGTLGLLTTSSLMLRRRKSV